MIHKDDSGLLKMVWKRWHREYVYLLHANSKWFRPSANLVVGYLVIVEEQNSFPLHWHLGRIILVCPGNDFIIWQVIVKMTVATFHWPAIKLYCLPVDSPKSLAACTLIPGRALIDCCCCVGFGVGILLYSFYWLATENWWTGANIGYRVQILIIRG